MKKQIAVILLLCTLCILLPACSGYEKGENFSEEFLKAVSLEGMPKPTCEKYALNDRTAGVESLRMEITLKEFEDYINAFIAYMNGREDIYYFGTQDNDGLIAEMMPHRVAHPVEGDFQWESGHYWYKFIYSLSNQTADHNACSAHMAYKDPIIVHFEYDHEDNIAYAIITQNNAYATDCMDEALMPKQE